MPYIPNKERAKYDELINALSHILMTRKDNDQLSGEMNYVLFRLASLLCDGDSGGKHNYARITITRILQYMAKFLDKFKILSMAQQA